MMQDVGSSLRRALTAPRTVALVGASATPGKTTARPLAFLRQHGFGGTIHPVNPSRPMVMGLPAHPTVAAIPEPVEHAFLLVDADAALKALEDCAGAGIPVVTIFADGFAEAGEEGRARQRRAAEIAKDAGILLVGPNSTGVVSTANGFACTTNAAFGTERLLPGRLAVLSQSGSVIGTILSRGQARGFGFGTFVSVGNEACAGVGEIGQLLVDDPETDGFALFLETVRDREALAAFAAAAAAAGKPIVAYVVGRSEEGRALSVSHTGALTGSAQALSAFLREIGIREVTQFESLIDAPRTLARVSLPASRPRTVTVVTTTGGGGAMVVDQISARGVEIAGCSAAARAHLTARGIAFGDGKLVDVTMAGTRYDTMREVVSTLVSDPATGLLVVAIGSSAQFNPELSVRPIVDAVAAAHTDAAPVLAFPLPHAPESCAMLDAGGVPAFAHVETCAETVMLLLDTALPKRVAADALPQQTAALLARARPGVLDEVQSGDVMESLGLRRPAQIVLVPGHGLPDLLPFDFPVVAKLVSADLPHKTEAGAIRLDLPDHPALEAAIAQMLRDAEAWRPGYSLAGVLVQQMCRGAGEALIGLTRDPVAGPVVTLGMGGVMTEIYRDIVVRPAPVSAQSALEMIDQVRGFELLRGFRGRPRGDLSALAEAVAALSRLALCDRVEEAEANPVLIHAEGDGVVILDALIRMR